MPALQLPRDVALGLAQLAQSDGGRVDRMDASQRLGDRHAGAGPGRLAHLLRARLVSQHEAVDVLHDVEGRAVHRVVGAEPDHRWYRHVGRAKGRDDAMLSAHVVRRGEHLPERRAAQHPPLVVGIAHHEGQVGAAARDEVEAERWPHAGRVLLEPAGNRVDVDPLGLLHRSSTVP